MVPVLLPECKHVDRARQHCCASLRQRVHKRGYLTVECTLAHQWVWCSHCCTCNTQGYQGCRKAAHWMERDSFDTGKRNHMQRHAKEVLSNTPLEPSTVLPLSRLGLAGPGWPGRKRRRTTKELTSENGKNCPIMKFWQTPPSQSFQPATRRTTKHLVNKHNPLDAFMILRS